MKQFFSADALPFYLAGILLLAAFIPAVVTTSALVEPPEIDFYRDMGAAETIQHGGLFSDPNIPGEYRWYNPLVPGIVAVIQRLTGAPMPALYARVGAYLNLLSPLMFFVMVTVWLGRWTAVPALAGYLFLGLQHDPSWFGATYSPWLWPCNFAQSLAFATVSLYVVARRGTHWGWEVATGVVLGITFLGHTAPAVILATYVTLTTAWHLVWPDQRPRLHEIRQLLFIGITSFLVSSPYLLPIIFVYRMRLANTQAPEYVPWRYGGLDSLLLQYATIKTLVAAVGLVAVVAALFRMRGEQDNTRRAGEPRLLLLLGATTLGYVVYALIAQEVLHSARLFSIFHYGIYCKAAEAVLFGVGIVWLANDVCRRCRQGGLPAGQLTGGTPLELEERTGNRYALVVIVLLMTGTALPGYCRNRDLTFYHDEAIRHAEQMDRIKLYQWTREQTRIDDVFASDQHLAHYAIVAAGRKVVCTHGEFINPFIKFEPREEDTRAIYDALREEQPDYKTFDRLAKKYDVKYVVAHDASRADPYRLSARQAEFLTKDVGRFRLVFHSGDVRVLEVNLPSQ